MNDGWVGQDQDLHFHGVIPGFMPLWVFCGFCFHTFRLTQLWSFLLMPFEITAGHMLSYRLR
jgi:hypothetical protein